MTQPAATINFKDTATDSVSTTLGVPYSCGGYKYSLTPIALSSTTLNLISLQNPLQPIISLSQTNFTLDATIYSFQVQVGFQNSAYTSTSLSRSFLVQYAPLIAYTTNVPSLSYEIGDPKLIIDLMTF